MVLKNTFRLWEARRFQGYAVMIRLQDADQYFQQALHAGTNDDLLRRSNYTARFITIFSENFTQFGFTLRLTVSSDILWLFQGIVDAAPPEGSVKGPYID